MSSIISTTYDIYRKLGAGGGGSVYLAQHKRLEKQVVLKVYKRKTTTTPEKQRREVDILKHLSHPRIPQVYDFFAEDGNVYTVMELIEGESLDHPLRRGETFPQSLVVRWAIQLLDALNYLHSPIHGDPPRGYAHSDVKPANLMRRSNGDICLIDFNVALAIGEENVVGCSIGYASPEHYGYDYSENGITATADEATARLEQESLTLPLQEKASSSSSSRKTVIPDARSDVYSVGATLYHLLSGKKPNQNALKVEPLSEQEFSPEVVKIIAKAMRPNPDLRYQTAGEMLDAFLHLRENDPRVRRARRVRTSAWAFTGALFLLGASAAFVGLKRMQATEEWLKLAEYSGNALAKGDTAQAVDLAMQALPEKSGLLVPDPLPEAQRALTEALGVYDLSDGWKDDKAVTLPSEPLSMAIAPNGETAVCMYKGFAAVIDTERGEILCTLPAEDSALAEVEYLDDTTILYAGADGICAYNIESGTWLWKGEPATAISISGDKSTVAAVYKDTASALVYDAVSGEVRNRVDFAGKTQSASINDKFASLNEHVFALNPDGSMLAVSSSDGSLELLNLRNPEEAPLMILQEGLGYTHFEGGFYQKYFAFSATNGSGSLVAVIDTEEKSQTGGFEAKEYCGLQADGSGIFVQSGSILVKMDPVNGEQTPMASTSVNIARFARGGDYTLVASDVGVIFFDRAGNLVTERVEEYGSDFIRIAGETALIGSLDSPVVRIMKLEGHKEAEIFAYDPLYPHDEARVSADGKTVTLFSYRDFRIYGEKGELIAEVAIPDPDKVYDQQYVRDGEESVLKVFYQDGSVDTYSGADGTLLKEESGEVPDMDLNEEFFTDNLRIEAPLHGTAMAYDRKTGKRVGELSKDAYLAYVDQAGEYVVARYRTVDGKNYGILMDNQCRELAYLPNLCDVMGEELVFDYSGSIRKTKMRSLAELMEMGKEAQAFSSK